MNKLILFILLSIILMACSLTSAVATVRVASTSTAEADTYDSLRSITPVPLITIIGNVYVRDGNGMVIGSYKAGTRVQAVCAGDTCKTLLGYVFRGCTSDNPGKLGCKAKGK